MFTMRGLVKRIKHGNTFGYVCLCGYVTVETPDGTKRTLCYKGPNTQYVTNMIDTGKSVLNERSIPYN